MMGTVVLLDWCPSCTMSSTIGHDAGCPSAPTVAMPMVPNFLMPYGTYSFAPDSDAELRAALREIMDCDPAWTRLPRELRRRIAALANREAGAVAP